MCIFQMSSCLKGYYNIGDKRKDIGKTWVCSIKASTQVRMIDGDLFPNENKNLNLPRGPAAV